MPIGSSSHRLIAGTGFRRTDEMMNRPFLLLPGADDPQDRGQQKVQKEKKDNRPGSQLHFSPPGAQKHPKTQRKKSQ